MDKNRMVLDYVIALTHLYGLVHKDKVVEIYNRQNDKKIDADVVDGILKEEPKDLQRNFIKTHGDYFVAETILEYHDFDSQLRKRKGKPFYIPKKEQLMDYKDEGYFERNKEYMALVNYTAEKFFHGDKPKAEVLCEDVQGICQFGFSLNGIFEEFNHRDVSFENEQQVSEVMQLIMDLANNTRLWENNGHTPAEISNKVGRQNLKPTLEDEILDLLKKPDVGGSNLRVIPGGAAKKVGRNDPCPCGSGKKYKKCCGK